MNCVIFHPATDISTELFCKFFATSMIPLLKQSPRGNRNDEVQYTENQGEEAPTKIMAVAGYALGCAREAAKNTCMLCTEHTQTIES